PIAAGEVADVLDRISSQQFAKAGLESAYYVAEAISAKVPLWKRLGGTNRPIPSGLAIGIYPTVEELLARIEQYLADGYQRVKIKITPGWDVEPVGRVRARWPTLPLMVDANAAYDASHLNELSKLDAFDLMMIEQPFATDALDESAELQRKIRTPICLDESAESVESVRTICEKRAGRIINIKMQRVGGIRRSVQIHDLARARGLACWLGTMPELGIASAAGPHLATLENFTFPTDVESSDRWFVDDVLEPPIVVDAGGFLHFPTGPGLGYRPSPEKIRKYTVREEIIQP
ncbi:MAG: o-succinylbenzoate synthase, partial [Phycisphaerae bacterium]